MIASTCEADGTVASPTYPSTSAVSAAVVPGYHVPACAVGLTNIVNRKPYRRYSASMSSFSPDDVRRLASLARLQLSDAEIASFARQLGEILDFARQVQSAGSLPD